MFMYSIHTSMYFKQHPHTRIYLCGRLGTSDPREAPAPVRSAGPRGPTAIPIPSRCGRGRKRPPAHPLHRRAGACFTLGAAYSIPQRLGNDSDLSPAFITAAPIALDSRLGCHSRPEGAGEHRIAGRRRLGRNVSFRASEDSEDRSYADAQRRRR